MLNAFGSPRNLDKRRLQLAKNTGVVSGGRRWCGAGSPSALMVLLCVWCVAGIGARAHRVSDEERFLWFDNPNSKLVRMRVRVRIRVHVTGGVLQIHLTYVGRLSEQPHWRSLAVAKPRCSGGQTRCTCELSGLCKVYHPKRLSLIHISEPTRPY